MFDLMRILNYRHPLIIGVMVAFVIVWWLAVMGLGRVTGWW